MLLSDSAAQIIIIKTNPRADEHLLNTYETLI
jgi:hypothetical protein